MHRDKSGSILYTRHIAIYAPSPLPSVLRLLQWAACLLSTCTPRRAVRQKKVEEREKAREADREVVLAEVADPAERQRLYTIFGIERQRAKEALLAKARSFYKQ